MLQITLNYIVNPNKFHLDLIYPNFDLIYPNFDLIYPN